MATIQGLTAPRMLEIEAAAIVAGVVDENMHLILTKHDGTTIDAGKVQGDGVPMGGTEGQIIIKTVDGSIWADNFATNVEQVIKNSTGATLTKGTAVYVSGASGDNVLVSKAQANSEGTSSKTLGLLHNDVTNGATGQVITEGTLYGFNTSAATVGDPVWLSPTTAGGLVYGLANKPTVPNHMVYLGVVIRSHAVNGAIYVKVQNGYELDELHDVKITNPQPKQVIKRDPTNQFWLNEAASGGVVVSGSTPTDPSVGDGWFYDADGALFFRYFDGTNYAYVQANVPMSPTIEQRYFSPNIIINGAFDIWQRGTSFTSTGYTADRWYSPISNSTVSQETSDLPSNFRYGIKYVTTAASAFSQFNQPIERDTVIGLRGKTITVSGWVKISGAFLGDWNSQAYYSTTSDAYSSQTTLVPNSVKKIADASTTSWVKFSNTFVVPVDAVGLRIENAPTVVSGSGVTVRMAGLQVELGSTSTDFRRNANSLQGELAACQRYYYRMTASGAGFPIIYGAASSNATVDIPIYRDMRVAPTSIEAINYNIYRLAGQVIAGTTASLYTSMPTQATMRFTGTAGQFAGGEGVFLYAASMPCYIAISAEL
jgi:hypothetical protein